ncbi:N-acetylmuramidase domain-containing protein [Bradyrhizobium lablabi]|nr:N-acetylmuramidase domain-containing protein [Bradyrhizobium lablabi]
MFSDKLALQIADAAEKAGIPKAGMLAIVEVETAGAPTEADGRTPVFLFERHIFRRELAARQPAKVAKAERFGLAIPKWDKATQYRDERNSAQRLALLARAKAVDEDCALRSCSWGLPQIMGNECREVGFASATQMVEYLTTQGVAGHIELMIRFLKSRKLISAIERGDWAYVALRYNGEGYRQNQYDTRLAAANRKWTRKLPTLEAVPVQDWPEEHLSREEIEQIQIKLRELKYPEAGLPDGKWGTKTIGALSAFQAHEGLPVTGHYDQATREALAEADARPVSPEREGATLDDLREAGSTTIARADTVDAIGKGKVIVGGTVGAGAVIEQAGTALNNAQDAADKATQVKTLWASVHDLIQPIIGHPVVIVIAIAVVIGGYFVIRYAHQIRAARLADHQSGTHAGVMEQ